MAPTVNTNKAAVRNKRPVAGERSGRDLVCRVKYCNTLQDIPFDPKFINYPFPANRYQQYVPTSLEKNYKHEVLTEPDLGVTIDLINPDTYSVQPGVELHPDDEKLLEDDVMMPQDLKRSRHHHVNVSWLRRTEYISTETTRYQPQNMDKMEATVGYATRRKAKKQEENLYTDRESQLRAIEQTFSSVKKPLKHHYSKPGVTAVEELQLFPDFKTWKYPCAQVIFDSDPAPVGRSVPAQIEEMSQAMIRGIMDESGEQFVAYFLPTQDTLAKRQEDKDNGRIYKDDEEYDYTMAREFNWNVKNKSSKGYIENYFFVIRPDGVYYNELETRVRLSKRRLKLGQKQNRSRLILKHRPLNESEFKAQRIREKALEPPCDDDEDEEDEPGTPLPDEDVDMSNDEEEQKMSEASDDDDKASDNESVASKSSNSSAGSAGSNASRRSNNSGSDNSDADSKDSGSESD